MLLSTVAMTTVLFSLARGADLQSRALSGEATFYGGNLNGGACSFSTYTLPSDLYGTALSDSNWDNAGNCGACISVAGPAGNSITAMIVDECPGCGPNHLDLFPDAFAKLASPSTGVIQTTWSFIDCPITTPMQLVNKQGVSAYWFSMQVVNANKAVASLEVSTDGGSTWTNTERQSYNFFQYSSGFGTTTVDVKVTSIDNDIVVVNDVYVASGAATTAASNFGSAGPAADVSSADVSYAAPPTTTTVSQPSDASATDVSSPPPTILPTGVDSGPPGTAVANDPQRPATSSAAAPPTTLATTYTAPAPSTAVPVATSTLTVYSYEDCPA